jgi:hypothetical protein
MAIVDGPAMSLRASGNMGAICYTRWRGMQIARKSSDLVFQDTTPQQKAKDAVGLASKAWSGTLTPEQRAMWEEYARSQRKINRLGLRWTPSGYHIFMSRSTQAQLFGGVIQVTPPISMRAVSVLSVSILARAEVGKASIEMTFPTAPYRPDVMQVFRAGPYDGGGRHAIAPEFLEVQQVVDPFNWIDTGLSSGKYYWYRVRWGLLEGVVSSNWFGQVLVL